MADDDGDKTEEPTAKKLSDAREKGNVGRSQDLTAVLIMIAGCAFIFLFGQRMYWMCAESMRFLMGSSYNIEINQENLMPQAHDALLFVLSGTMPFFILVLVVALLANVLQVGFSFSLKPLAPDFSRLDPIKGLQKKFSLRTLVQGAMNLSKVAVVTWVAWLVISNAWVPIFRCTGQDLGSSLHLLFVLLGKLSLYMLLVLLALAILDFAYNKWQHIVDLRMTKQEVKDEMRNYEGDPKIKARQRQIRMQMLRRRMLKDVKDADVVITNPTHISVAVRYDMDKMRAPIVVAKGEGALALRIREIAEEHGVPKYENKELARSLYRWVEVGEYIPEQFFKAVAEILAFVYNLKKQKAGARAS